MQIDGARPQLTPAGEGDPCPAKPGEDRPQKDDGGAHFPHARFRNFPALRRTGIHFGGTIRMLLYLAAQRPQNVHSRGSITQPGTAFNPTLRWKQCCCQHRKRRIFGTMYLDCSPERYPSLNDVNCHKTDPPS